MQRQMRRSWRKVGKLVGDVRNRASQMLSNRIDNSYTTSWSTPTQQITAVSTSTDDDENDPPVFGPVRSDSVSSNGSSTTVVCEYCHQRVNLENLNRHEIRCQRYQNFNGDRVRRVRETRYTSESAVTTRVIPSAPSRSRSASIESDCQPDAIVTCPITKSLFRNPVVASDGHVYEREAIEEWMKTNRRSPMTRDILKPNMLTPVLLIKKLADEYRERYRAERKRFVCRLGVDLNKGRRIDDRRYENFKEYLTIQTQNPVPEMQQSILVHFTGDQTSTFENIYRNIPQHENLVRIRGQVRHENEGVIFIREDESRPTLYELMEGSVSQFSIEQLDSIAQQVLDALKCLYLAGIAYGYLTAHDILVENQDTDSRGILIKLKDISNYLFTAVAADNEVRMQLKNEILFNKENPALSNIYTFGIFVANLYPDSLLDSDRQLIVQSCLEVNPENRPTFDQISKFFFACTSNRQEFFSQE